LHAIVARRQRQGKPQLPARRISAAALYIPCERTTLGVRNAVRRMPADHPVPAWRPRTPLNTTDIKMTEVKSGDVVRIHYTGKLEDGTQFGSSAGDEPLEVRVGAGQIIPGLDSKIEGMTVGEKETVTIPVEE